MEVLLVLALLAFTTVLGLSVFTGQPLRIEITHRTEVPPAQEVPQTPEDMEAELAHRDVARVLQEIAGVFHDDDHGTERTV